MKDKTKELFDPKIFNRFDVKDRVPQVGDQIFVPFEAREKVWNVLIDVPYEDGFYWVKNENGEKLEYTEYFMFNPHHQALTDLLTTQEYKDALKAKDDGKALLELIRPIYERRGKV